MLWLEHDFGMEILFVSFCFARVRRLRVYQGRMLESIFGPKCRRAAFVGEPRDSARGRPKKIADRGSESPC
jgi:hypothetical protein